MEAVCSRHAHLSASATTKEDLPSITCPHFLWQTNNHLVTCGWIRSQESQWDQTCLFLHLKFVLLTVSCVILHCDTYSGQNRDQFVAAALQQAVQTMPSVQTTDHRVLESGHSQMKWLNHQYTQPLEGQNKSQQSWCLLDVETFEREELRKLNTEVGNRSDEDMGVDSDPHDVPLASFQTKWQLAGHPCHTAERIWAAYWPEMPDSQTLGLFSFVPPMTAADQTN